MSNTVPKLKPRQVSLIRADINTGHVLKTNNELYVGQGETLEIFDSIELAETFIKERLTERDDIEYVIYDSNSDPIEVWDRKGKRNMKK
jgi:hypothetical protein